MWNTKNALMLLMLLSALIEPLHARALEEIAPERIELERIENDAISVRFEPALRRAAEEALSLYPAIQSELEQAFGQTIDFRPDVILMNDRAVFQSMAGGDHFAAFAQPQGQRIVIDYTQMAARPFHLGITLKHELAHLLIHRRIPPDRLPKWLDEGLAQWASGGFSEILMNDGGGPLRKAGLSGALIPLRDLDAGFPKEKTALLLAYAQSKSLVNHIEKEYGGDALRRVLAALRAGEDIGAAIEKHLSVSLGRLEGDWRKQLKNEGAWWVYLGGNLSVFLFTLAALVTAVGFVRFWIKKRNYTDDEHEAVLPYGLDDFDNLDETDDTGDIKY